MRLVRPDIFTLVSASWSERRQSGLESVSGQGHLLQTIIWSEVAIIKSNNASELKGKIVAARNAAVNNPVKPYSAKNSI